MIGIFETGGSIGVLVAPLIAGFVGSYFGWRYVYTLWAIPAFIAAFLFYRVSFRRKPGDKSSRTKLARRDTPTEYKKRSSVNCSTHPGVVYLTQGFFGFVSGGAVSFLPLFLTDVHKFSAGVAGGLLTLFLAAGAVGKIIGGRCSDKWGTRKIIGIGFLITCFFLMLVPFAAGFSLILILLFGGIAFFMILPALFLSTSEIKTGDLGLAYGIQILSGTVFGACSRLLSGIISDLLGIKYVFFLLSAVAFFATIFVYLYLKSH